MSVVSAANLEGEKTITLWSMGAWGGVQGYPSSCTMYQDRLIMAGSKYQPQTIWMSRTGDYADYATSDPLRDDDAVTITLAGSSADGIHSMISAGDLLVFTTGGEWKVKGSGDSGAITPTALAAHQQASIGTKAIQPLEAGGHVILVQAQGRKVYALSYDLNTDGYTGSELTILSGHIFDGKQIVSMTYQKIPDNLLWFVLDDGTAAVCTYNPEHEVIAWSRHDFPEKLRDLAAMSGATQTEVIGGTYNNTLIYQKERTESAGFTDWGNNYESRMRTLRLRAGSEDSNGFTDKKLAARVTISAVRSGTFWAAPGEESDRNRYERRRKVRMNKTDYLEDEEIQLDNGFSNDASIELFSIADEPMTIAAITPHITSGG